MLQTNSVGVIRKGLFAFSLAALVILAGSQAAWADDKSLSFENLVRDVKIALGKVQKSAYRESLPPLKRIVLELTATQATDANGKLALYIVNLGGNHKSEVVNTIKLVLVPPGKDAGSDVGNAELVDVLSETILSGARAIAQAGKGQPPLEAKDFAVTVQFGVTNEGDGGLKLAFPPFEGSVGAGISAANIQKITIEYENK